MTPSTPAAPGVSKPVERDTRTDLFWRGLVYGLEHGHEVLGLMVLAVVVVWAPTYAWQNWAWLCGKPPGTVGDEFERMFIWGCLLSEMVFGCVRLGRIRARVLAIAKARLERPR